jgi:hypothetical protein
MDPDRELNTAEGLVIIGLYQDAWDTIEELPPEFETLPRVLRVRLACCIGLDAWERGSEIASLMAQMDLERTTSTTLRPSGSPSAIPWERGLVTEAREVITRAIQASPKVREEILDDKRFD